MLMLRKTAIVAAAVALGIGFAACGEDREGDVEFQGTETTGTTGTTGTETTGTETTGTETSP